MDFKLDKSHLLQQELFRRFAETEIKPLAKEMDEKEEYDLELLAKMQKYGFFGIPYSKEYGGAGSDTAGLHAVHGGGLQDRREHRHHHFCSHVAVLLVHQQLRYRGAEAEVSPSSD